jgi:2-amino-4-hydroxy-6-hydroxymethyldihydropteridine diphosphokinase
MYLSLGSNVGDRKALIDAAVRRIGELPETNVLVRSSYYKTAPVGPVKQQAWFLNIAVGVETGLSRVELASACRVIEEALGRDRAKEIPSGPRPIDIDVLGSPLDDRSFVLAPLAEIAPGVMFDGVTVEARLAKSSVRGVTRLAWPLPEE